MADQQEIPPSAPERPQAAPDPQVGVPLTDTQIVQALIGTETKGEGTSGELSTKIAEGQETRSD
jgi:hypothetical protein